MSWTSQRGLHSVHTSLVHGLCYQSSVWHIFCCVIVSRCRDALRFQDFKIGYYVFTGTLNQHQCCVAADILFPHECVLVWGLSASLTDVWGVFWTELSYRRSEMMARVHKCLCIREEIIEQAFVRFPAIVSDLRVSVPNVPPLLVKTCAVLHSGDSFTPSPAQKPRCNLRVRCWGVSGNSNCKAKYLTGWLLAGVPSSEPFPRVVREKWS